MSVAGGWSIDQVDNGLVAHKLADSLTCDEAHGTGWSRVCTDVRPCLWQERSSPSSRLLWSW